MIWLMVVIWAPTTLACFCYAGNGDFPPGCTCLLSHLIDSHPPDGKECDGEREHEGSGGLQ